MEKTIFRRIQICIFMHHEMEFKLDTIKVGLVLLGMKLRLEIVLVKVSSGKVVKGALEV